MKRTRLIVTAVLSAGAVAANYLTSAAIAAARPIPIPARFGRTATPPPTIITHSGSPWWVFVIVAAMASALTITVSIAVARLRDPRPRRHYTLGQYSRSTHSRPGERVP